MGTRSWLQRSALVMVTVAMSTSLPVAGVAAEPAPAPDLAAVLDAHAAVRTSIGLAGQARVASVPGSDGTEAPSTAPPDDEVIENVAVSSGAVAVGAEHTCALGPFGDVWCFGDNSAGQLGVGGTDGESGPQRVSAEGALAGRTTVALSAGATHTCAVSVDAETESESTAVYCWGGNAHGQVGGGATDEQARPVEVIADAIRVVTGTNHSCALLNTGEVYCWGANDLGQLGVGSTGADETTPQPVKGLSGVLDLSAGGDTTCAVVDGDGARCWGSDSDGQLGDGAGGGAAQSAPVAVDTADIGAGLAKIAVGHRHVCALNGTGKAYCWGSGSAGQLGAGAATDEPAPAAVTTKSTFFDIAAGGDSSCAVDVSGQAYCWGDNSDGQLGVGGDDDRDVPAKVDQSGVRPSPITRIVLGSESPLVASVSMGESHACGVDVQGTVYCWGAGAAGQLGDGGTEGSDIPAGTVLTPDPATGLRVSGADEALGAAWTAPPASGVAPVKEYAALAASGAGVDALLDLEVCSTTALTCRIENLENKRRYEVFVGTATMGGVSFSESTPGVPQASGAGGSLPITGAGVIRLVAVAALLIAAGALGMALGRRRRHRPHGGRL